MKNKELNMVDEVKIWICIGIAAILLTLEISKMIYDNNAKTYITAKR